MQPTVVRSNHRYRGPVESQKIDQFKEAVHTDLTRAYQALDALKTELDSLLDSFTNGREFDFPEAIYSVAQDGSISAVPITRIEGRGRFNERLQTLATGIRVKGGEIYG